MTLVDSNNPNFSGVATLNGLNLATTADLANLQNLLNQMLPSMILEIAYNGGVTNTTTSTGSSNSGGSSSSTAYYSEFAFGWFTDSSETVYSIFNNLTVAGTLPKYKTTGNAAAYSDILSCGAFPNTVYAGSTSVNSGLTYAATITLNMAVNSAQTGFILSPTITVTWGYQGKGGTVGPFTDLGSLDTAINSSMMAAGFVSGMPAYLHDQFNSSSQPAGEGPVTLNVWVLAAH